MLRTLDEFVRLVKGGLSKAEGEWIVDEQMYKVSCYKVGDVIRIDLKPKEG